MAIKLGDSSLEAPMADINTTPLVDVMLVLLVVFIVTAPLLTQSISLQLPKAAASEHVDIPDAVQMSINAEGQWFVDDQPVADLPALQARFEEVARRDPDTPLHVRADSQARYELVARAMAAAQRAGLTRIGLITEAPSP